MWLLIYEKIYLFILLSMRVTRCFLFGHEYISIDREGYITVCMYCGKEYIK